jgi:hypothetical protein
LITMEQQVRDNVYLDRLIAILSTRFAGLATLLASIGLYGILAYNVTLRTRQLGLRLALGATPRHLCAMVLKHVGTMAFVGGDRARGRGRLGALRRGATLRLNRLRPARAVCGSGRARRRSAGCRIHAVAAGVSHRADGSASIRMT